MATSSVKISTALLNKVGKRVGKTGTKQGFVESAISAALNGAFYSDADLVSFGKFLYSAERKNTKKRDKKENGPVGIPLSDILSSITAEDLLNWKELTQK